MKFLKKCFKTALAVLVVALPLQFATITNASAAGTDAEFYAHLNHDYTQAYPGQQVGPGPIWVDICSSGSDSFESVTFQSTATNFNITGYELQPAHPSWNSATDLGSVTAQGVWTGLLEAGQCTTLNMVGEVTGNIGDEIEITTVFTNVVLVGGALASNVNNGGVDSSESFTVQIGAPVDLSVTTRLLTPGPIGSGSNVSYELNLRNVGDSVYNSSQVQVYFVLPQGSTFNNVTDGNSGDTLALDSCQVMLPNINVMFPQYDGALLFCNFVNSLGNFPLGANYPMIFNLTVGSAFSSETTEVFGVLIAQGETDSDEFVNTMNTGGDPFDLSGNNNIVNLPYNNDVLKVTVNRCAGQSAITTNGSGCFTVSFNKLIYAPSFVQSDLVLSGGGAVSSFTQVDDYTWEVGISGITPGSTLALTLGADSVQDWNAVMNDVQVLGENTIRFEVAGGTLANTGIDSLEWMTAVALLMIGFVLVRWSRKNEIKSVRRISL